MGLVYVVFFSKAFNAYCTSVAMRDDVARFPELSKYYFDGVQARAECARKNAELESKNVFDYKDADEE